jgi:hypothetical protein
VFKGFLFHFMHVLVTLFTCGLWVPFYVVMATIYHGTSSSVTRTKLFWTPFLAFAVMLLFGAVLSIAGVGR